MRQQEPRQRKIKAKIEEERVEEERKRREQYGGNKKTENRGGSREREAIKSGRKSKTG